MKTGYGVFGKAYEKMLRNDLHSPRSVDCRLIETMVLLDEQSYPILYHSPSKISPKIKEHELYAWAQRFKKSEEQKTIKEILSFTSSMADSFNLPFDEMLFGGTEKEILDRNTDWCADISRVGAVLLQCVGIPSRIIHLVNRSKAYHGHVVVEGFYCGKYGVLDFLHGYCFYDKAPLDTFELIQKPEKIKKVIKSAEEDYCRLYDCAAISEYDPMDNGNDYTISKPNRYYLTLISQSNDNGVWLMGEDR